jgi:hypothetical protein
MDSTKLAVLDKEHSTRIGYETFFFADLDAKKKFDLNMARYCGAVTDPVTKQRFVPGDASPHMYSGACEFFFESDSTRRVFAMMPMDFMDPAYHMYAADSTKKEG